MVKESRKAKSVEVVSEKDAYLWAFISIKSELDIVENLNEQLPRFFRPKDSVNAVEIQSALARLETVIQKVERDGLKNAYAGLSEEDRIQKLIFESIVRMKGNSIIRDMSLVYIVAIFEDFLQKILRISFKRKPELLMTCQKNVTYEELLQYDDINNARDGIIEKEIEIVNEDVEVVRQYINRKFNVDISRFVDWKEFKERFYRRNILVHNSGIPNKTYRLKTGCKDGSKRLTVSMDYLKTSIALFVEMSLRIGITLERKIK